MSEWHSAFECVLIAESQSLWAHLTPQRRFHFFVQASDLY